MTTQQPVTTFVELLEGARQRRGLSQARAAKLVGASQTTYRQWLRGQRPDWNRIPALVEFTEVPEEKLTAAILRHGAVLLYITWSDGEKRSKGFQPVGRFLIPRAA